MGYVEPANTLLINPIGLTKKIQLTDGIVHSVLNTVNSMTEFPLNESQKSAFINTFETPLTLIWGPPGTGKTDTLSKIIIGWLERTDKKNINILIGSNNYNAIDNVLKKFLEQYTKTNAMNIFRVRGSSRETIKNNQVIDINTSEKRDRERIFKELSSPTKNNIVATTWKQIINVPEKDKQNITQQWFDLIIIDEASQVPVSNAMGYFLLAKSDGHFILAGDPKQLGPIYSYQIEEENYLYDCIFTYYSEKFKIPMQALNTTYRSNSPITLWPAERFYDNNYSSFDPDRCLNHPPLIAPKEKPIDWPKDLLWDPSFYILCNPEYPISILVHDDQVSTLSNSFESDVIAALTYIYNNLYQDNAQRFWSERLGIVTPHRAQVATIRNKVAALCGFDDDLIAVDSVDKYQGDEREIILSSYSVSDKDFIKSEEEFILNAKRFNVTLTRAKSKFILVISKSLLEYISGDLTIAQDASHLQMFITKYCTFDKKYQITHNSPNMHTYNCSIYYKDFN